MIIVFACVVVVAVESAFLQRRLLRLGSLRFRRFYLLWLALLDQVLVISVLPGRQHVVLDIADLLSYVAAGAFVCSNRKVPGLLLVGAGGTLNIIAIAANGGTMPASASALAASGWRPQPGHFANSAVVAHPKLAVLGDIFATPRWVPAHDVFSIGDVLIVIAVAVLVYRTCATLPGTESGHTAPDEPTERIGAPAGAGAPVRNF
jgi:hypothetical protein